MNKHEADQEILKALGLDHLVVESLRIKLIRGGDTEVDAVIIVPPERVGDLGTRLKTFKLVPREVVYGE